MGDRLTITGLIHHEQEGEQPSSFDTAFSMKLTTSDQPLDRRLKATKEWLEIDSGWIQSPGMFVVWNDRSNEENQIILSPEELEAEAGKCLEVRFGDCENFAVIAPRDFLRMRLSKMQSVFVRSKSGDVLKFRLIVYPQ